MIRLAVVSDCHGAWREVARRLKDLQIDGLICLGDMVTDGEQLADMLGVEYWCVCGNCDLICGYEQELVLDFEGVSFLVCHGHAYGVKNSLLGLKYRAMELNCQGVLFGHNHLWCDEEIDGIRFCNPGSAGRPRDFVAGVGFLEIEKGSILAFTRIPI